MCTSLPPPTNTHFHMASHDDAITAPDAIEDEIAQLEAKLHAARGRLHAAKQQQPPSPDTATQLPVRIPPHVSCKFTSIFLQLDSDCRTTEIPSRVFISLRMPSNIEQPPVPFQPTSSCSSPTLRSPSAPLPFPPASSPFSRTRPATRPFPPFSPCPSRPLPRRRSPLSSPRTATPRRSPPSTTSLTPPSSAPSGDARAPPRAARCSPSGSAPPSPPCLLHHPPPTWRFSRTFRRCCARAAAWTCRSCRATLRRCLVRCAAWWD